MEKYIVLMLIITVGVYSNITDDTNQTKENNTTEKSKNIIVIDLDKEIEDTRGSTNQIVDGPIFLRNDNDEVSFSGRKYNIRTLELKDGDHIIIKDRDGNIFVNKIVREY